VVVIHLEVGQGCEHVSRILIIKHLQHTVQSVLNTSTIVSCVYHAVLALIVSAICAQIERNIWDWTNSVR